MKRTGLKILILGLTALGLSAGVVAGMLASRLPAVNGGGATVQAVSANPTSLQELNLTPPQQEQMRRIWEDVRGEVQDCYQRADSLQKDRDEAIASILSDEQKAKFEKIAQDFAARSDQVAKKRENIIEKAVNQTRQLLTDEQRARYDRILKNRLGRVPATQLGQRAAS